MFYTPFGLIATRHNIAQRENPVNGGACAVRDYSIADARRIRVLSNPVVGRVASAPACGILLPVSGGRKRPALRRMAADCGFAQDWQDNRRVLRGAMWASRPTRCGNFVRRGRRPRRPAQSGRRAGCVSARLYVQQHFTGGRFAARPTASGFFLRMRRNTICLENRNCNQPIIP